MVIGWLWHKKTKATTSNGFYGGRIWAGKSSTVWVFYIVT